MTSLDKPLYIAADEKLLPDIEIMDEPTCKWIEGNGTYLIGRNYSVFDLSPYIKGVTDCIPDKSDFYNIAMVESLHGLRHSFRTAVYANLIASQMRMPSRLRNQLIIACLYHDIQRRNDNKDIGHEWRSAAWLIDNAVKIKRKLLSEGQQIDVARIGWLIANHNQVVDLKDNMLKVVKIADALDRYCQPNLKWWPNTDTMPKIKNMSKLLRTSFLFTLSIEREFVARGSSLKAIMKDYDVRNRK